MQSPNEVHVVNYRGDMWPFKTEEIKVFNLTALIYPEQEKQKFTVLFVTLVNRKTVQFVEQLLL